MTAIIRWIRHLPLLLLLPPSPLLFSALQLQEQKWNSALFLFLCIYSKGFRLIIHNVTVQAPANVTFKHPIFSTERYTENKSGDPSLLELYMPRFVQGAGSLIRIDTLIGKGTTVNGSYTFYATYDQEAFQSRCQYLNVPQPMSIIWLWSGMYTLNL